MEKLLMNISFETKAMSQLELRPISAGKTKGKIHHSLRIDMTPMVDLGFLLISFFIFTTTLSEKNTMDLIVPADGEDGIPIPESKTISFLLAGNNRIYAYDGKWETSINKKSISLTDYSPDGMRGIILKKQNLLANPDDLIVLIKPLEFSVYKNTVDALDEMVINGVKSYTIVDATVDEKAYVASLNN
jgi:biopolymer transport protein ExbD